MHEFQELQRPADRLGALRRGAAGERTRSKQTTADGSAPYKNAEPAHCVPPSLKHDPGFRKRSCYAQHHDRIGLDHGPVFALEHGLFLKSVTTLGSGSRAGFSRSSSKHPEVIGTDRNDLKVTQLRIFWRKAPTKIRRS
jgi:hypothetical protein